MKLYEISNEYLSVIEKCFDQETGEINELSLIELDEIKTKIESKSIAVASYIKNIEAEKKAIHEAVFSMQRRENILYKKIDFLTEYLKSNMDKCGLKEIKSPHFVLKLKKCPVSVDLSNEDVIPDKYKIIKQITYIDKIKIREDIKSGISINGAELKKNLRLEIN